MKESLFKGEIPFTMTSNELLNSPTISLKAKGLYGFMFSKPEGWKFTIRSMSKQLLEGKDAIASALDELKVNGWVDYNKNYDGSGEYFLRTKPNTENPVKASEPNPENPNPENPNMGKSGRINNKDSISKKDSNKNVSDDLFSTPGKKEKSASLDSRLFNSVDGSEVASEIKDYYLKAKAFYDLFHKNLTDAGSTTTQLEKVRFKSFVDPIRLMVERDNVTNDQFKKLFVFLSMSDFWKKNVLSTSKLRVQAPKLLIQAHQQKNGNTEKWADRTIENSGAATGARHISSDYIQRITKELSED